MTNALIAKTTITLIDGVKNAKNVMLQHALVLAITIAMVVLKVITAVTITTMVQMHAPNAKKAAKIAHLMNVSNVKKVTCSMNTTHAKNVQQNAVAVMNQYSNALIAQKDTTKKDGMKTNIQYAKNALEIARNATKIVNALNATIISI